MKKELYNHLVRKVAVAKAKSMQQPQGKATAELDASRNPMEFIKKNKNMSIGGLKGVAF
jgi:hypothetical protein